LFAHVAAKVRDYAKTDEVLVNIGLSGSTESNR
jgi:hypothetical protein